MLSWFSALAAAALRAVCATSSSGESATRPRSTRTSSCSPTAIPEVDPSIFLSALEPPEARGPGAALRTPTTCGARACRSSSASARLPAHRLAPALDGRSRSSPRIANWVVTLVAGGRPLHSSASWRPTSATAPTSAPSCTSSQTRSPASWAPRGATRWTCEIPEAGGRAAGSRASRSSSPSRRCSSTRRLGWLQLVVALLLWFAALVLGRAPVGLQRAGAYAIGYGAQLNCYLFTLTDRYPHSSPLAVLERRVRRLAVLAAAAGPARSYWRAPRRRRSRSDKGSPASRSA